MNDDDLVLIDTDKTLQWNYVNRVDEELALNSSHDKALINPLMPKSYKEVVMILSKACNYSRVALLLDDDENYVAFMLVVEEDYIPFMVEDLENIETPMTAVYKIFPNSKVARSNVTDGLLRDFIADTVIPSLNNDFDSWKSFKCIED